MSDTQSTDLLQAAGCACDLQCEAHRIGNQQQVCRSDELPCYSDFLVKVAAVLDRARPACNLNSTS